MTTELLHKAEATPGDIRSQLERILASRRFAISERSATFLRYVIDRTLAGDSAGIKEVVIAVEIYGRSADYDPKIDSVVRVEASRMRAKLKSYYDEEGSLDPVLITIPKGGYVPIFEVRETAEMKLEVERQLPALIEPPASAHDTSPQVHLVVLDIARRGVDRIGMADAPVRVYRHTAHSQCRSRRGLAGRQCSGRPGSPHRRLGSGFTRHPTARARTLRICRRQGPELCARLVLPRRSLRLRSAIRRPRCE